MPVVESTVFVVFTVYAVGLIVCIILSWAHGPRAEAAAKWLERFYQPFLMPLRRTFDPVHLGKATIDLCPWILLAGIVLMRELILRIIR